MNIPGVHQVNPLTKELTCGECELRRLPGTDGIYCHYTEELDGERHVSDKSTACVKIAITEHDAEEVKQRFHEFAIQAVKNSGLSPELKCGTCIVFRLGSEPAGEMGCHQTGNRRNVCADTVACVLHMVTEPANA